MDAYREECSLTTLHKFGHKEGKLGLKVLYSVNASREPRTRIININMGSNSLWLQAPSVSVSECLYASEEILILAWWRWGGIYSSTNGTFKGWLAPMMKDILHHLFGLQGLVVKDEGNATTHHLQPTSAVKHGATLTHNGHWHAERENRRGRSQCRLKLKLLQTSEHFSTC